VQAARGSTCSSSRSRGIRRRVWGLPCTVQPTGAAAAAVVDATAAAHRGFRARCSAAQQCHVAVRLAARQIGGVSWEVGSPQKHSMRWFR
jgi:hypothetical protein